MEELARYLREVTTCTFSECDMNQETLLSILYDTKEDFQDSMRQAMNRRLHSDIATFCRSIAAVSIAIQAAEEPHLSIQDINNIAQTLLAKKVVIGDLIFASKEFKETGIQNCLSQNIILAG
jgi:hypothetical protein